MYRNFHMPFCERKVMYLFKFHYSTEGCSEWFSWQWFSIASGNDFAQNKWQAVIWINYEFIPLFTDQSLMHECVIRPQFKAGINLVVRTAQFAHDNLKLRRNRRVGGNFFAQHVNCRKCAAVWPVVRYSKHGKKVKKLRLFQIFASLVNTTLSSRTFAVWILKKNIACACSGLCGWRQWPWNMHSVSADNCSLVPRLLPLWRIQHMLCIESVNSLVCHAGRLRSTVLMTSYKIVHMSPGKRVVWSSKPVDSAVRE